MFHGCFRCPSRHGLGHKGRSFSSTETSLSVRSWHAPEAKPLPIYPCCSPRRFVDLMDSSQDRNRINFYFPSSKPDPQSAAATPNEACLDQPAAQQAASVVAPSVPAAPVSRREAADGSWEEGEGAADEEPIIICSDGSCEDEDGEEGEPFSLCPDLEGCSGLGAAQLPQPKRGMAGTRLARALPGPDELAGDGPVEASMDVAESAGSRRAGHKLRSLAGEAEQRIALRPALALRQSQSALHQQGGISAAAPTHQQPASCRQPVSSSERDGSMRCALGSSRPTQRSDSPAQARSDAIDISQVDVQEQLQIYESIAKRRSILERRQQQRPPSPSKRHCTGIARYFSALPTAK